MQIHHESLNHFGIFSIKLVFLHSYDKFNLMNEKIYKLRLKLLKWEKDNKINKLSEKSKIIYSYLLAKNENLPISIKEIKKNILIKESMSTATFNRSINELIANFFINLESDPKDRRSLIVTKIKN